MNKTIVGEKNDEKKQGTVQDQRQLRLPIATWGAKLGLGGILMFVTLLYDTTKARAQWIINRILTEGKRDTG